MENSGAAQDGYGRETRSTGPSAARRTSTLVVAMLGSVAGGFLVIPLWIIAPYWLFLTLPQVFGAVFASSMAYLVAGPTKTTLSRVMVGSLLAAAACALVNLALFVGMVPGVVPSDDLILPGGWVTHLLEAAVIGMVAGVVAIRGGQVRQAKRISFWTALFLSALAITTLLIVGSSILPVLFNT